jgi:ketosteroid isomerase-like protein
MVTEGQQNLETVIFDYLGALREGNQEAVRAVLDPNVTWQGLHEDWVCHGPDEVIETLQEGLRLRGNVAALEFVRAGSRLVMGVRGPSLDEVGGEPLDGQIFNVFTPSNGKIVRIEDYRLRAEALKAAQADEDSRWR